MASRSWLRSTLRSASTLALVGAWGCGGDTATPGAVDAPPAADAPPGYDAPGGGAVLKRPSKSNTVAITDDDKFVAMVNPQDNSLSIFQTSSNTRTARVQTGGEPSAVVIAPDNTTAFVANRADATVVKVSHIDTASPTVTAMIKTGAEPTGLALSPTGAKLFVAELAEGAILVVDTASFTQAGLITGNIKHPRSVAVTNNNDGSDDDELVIVPEFFGEPNDNAKDASTLDKSRTGRVRIYDVKTLTAQTPITFAFRDSGVTPAGGTATVFTSPNSLYNVVVRRDPSAAADNTKARIYVPSVSVSPQAPSVFNGNIYPVVYVGDLGERAEIAGATGTVNLTEQLLDHDANGVAGKWFLADIVDLAFVPSGSGEGNVAYVLSRGGDVLQRVTFDDAMGKITLGSSANLQINLAGSADAHDGCKGPTGIVLTSDASKAYLNCWVSQRLGVVTLGSAQTLSASVEAFPPVTANASVDRGRRFFFTGRGRWSGDGKADVGATLNPPQHNDGAWSSCGSCHPDGLTDNVTWIFGTGPRQTTSMDGTFSKGPGAQKQRVLNATAINDEIHDFESNTRGTSGGLGALTTGDCTALATEVRQVLPGGVGAPAKALETTAGSCRAGDWDDIEAWVKTIRPPKGLQRLSPDQVTHGRQIFADEGTGVASGNCTKCHAGPGWTVSRRFYTPSADNATQLAALDFAGSAPWPALWNQQTKAIQTEQPSGVGPAHVSCVLRNLATVSAANTFGPAALEKKPDGSPAQGANGYNVPSLYGLALNAPYLHSGLATTLRDLLDSFPGHLAAGNDNFAPTSDEKDALVAFLLSIDASTPEVPVANGFDKCVDVP